MQGLRLEGHHTSAYEHDPRWVKCGIWLGRFDHGPYEVCDLVWCCLASHSSLVKDLNPIRVEKTGGEGVL